MTSSNKTLQSQTHTNSELIQAYQLVRERFDLLFKKIEQEDPQLTDFLARMTSSLQKIRNVQNRFQNDVDTLDTQCSAMKYKLNLLKRWIAFNQPGGLLNMYESINKANVCTRSMLAKMRQLQKVVDENETEVLRRERDIERLEQLAIELEQLALKA